MMRGLWSIIFIISMSDVITTDLVPFLNSTLNTECSTEHTVENTDNIQNIELKDYDNEIQDKSYNSFLNFVFYIWMRNTWVAVLVMSMFLLILCLHICIKLHKRCTTFRNCLRFTSEIVLPFFTIRAYITLQRRNTNFLERFELQNVPTQEIA